MTNSHTSICSAESADSRSRRSGPDSEQSASAKSTNTASASSLKTFYPTPIPSDATGGRTTKGRLRQNETGLRLAATSSPSTEASSPASISSQGDFLASHSVAPG